MLLGETGSPSVYLGNDVDDDNLENYGRAYLPGPCASDADTSPKFSREIILAIPVARIFCSLKRP